MSGHERFYLIHKRTNLMRGKIMGLMCCGAMFLLGCQSNQSTTKMAANSAASEQPCIDLDKKLAAASTQPAAQPAAEAQPAKKIATFGPAQKLAASDEVPVSKVLAAPEQYKDKYVRLTGKVTTVCPKRGCWVRIASDAKAPAGEDVFVKFRDPSEGFLVPLEAAGHDATIEGTVKLGMISEAMARHFKEDAGAPQEEIEKIVGPQKQIVIAGPALAVEGIEKAE
jgi:hypothetical protein